MPERTPARFRNPMSWDDAEALAATLHALADPTRLQLLSLVTAEPGTYAERLVAGVPVKQPTVHHHVRALRRVGLVAGRHVGTVLELTPTPEGLDLLVEQLRRWSR